MRMNTALVAKVLVVVMLVGAAGVTASVLSSEDTQPSPPASPGATRPGGEVEVPEVVGLELEAAEVTLRNAGLEPEAVIELGDEELWSSVMEQDPAPGRLVAAGSPVTLTATEARPPFFELPQMEGDTCPASEPKHHEHLRVALGDGKIRLGSATESGKIRLGSSGPKVDTLWASRGYRGPVLIRGGALDGTGEMTFEQTQGWAPRGPDLAGTSTEMRFRGRPPGDLGWHSLVTFSGPGCYGFQIDGRGFTEHIVVEVVR